MSTVEITDGIDSLMLLSGSSSATPYLMLNRANGQNSQHVLSSGEWFFFFLDKTKQVVLPMTCTRFGRVGQNEGDIYQPKAFFEYEVSFSDYLSVRFLHQPNMNTSSLLSRKFCITVGVLFTHKSRCKYLFELSRYFYCILFLLKSDRYQHYKSDIPSYRLQF